MEGITLSGKVGPIVSTIEPYSNNDSLLELQDNGTVKATGKPYDVGNPDLYFDVVYYLPPNKHGVLYQFKPNSQSEKYICIVHGQVVLKSENESEISERTFHSKKPNEDYLSLFVLAEGRKYYLSCDDNGNLYASTSQPEEESWFRIIHENEKNVVTASREELVFESNLVVDILTEIAYSEE